MWPSAWATAGPTGDDVVLRLRDDVTPAHVWTAATRYTATETAALIGTIERIVGSHRRAVISRPAAFRSTSRYPRTAATR